jgi:hypothetical protein
MYVRMCETDMSVHMHQALGMQPCEKSDSVSAAARTHRVLLSGKYMNLSVHQYVCMYEYRVLLSVYMHVLCDVSMRTFFSGYTSF